jgi:hypothetical protein
VQLKSVLFFSTLALSSLVQAEIYEYSAYRDPDTPYTFYEERALERRAERGSNTDIQNRSMVRRSPLRSSKLYNSEEDLPKTTVWGSKKLLQERFEALRDMRFLEGKNGEEFPRRVSWLFPDDGCYARAALVNRNAFREFIPIPEKVFAFGNLRVKTGNSPRGRVSWWYHVAPIVEVDSEKYVIDPAIEAKRPLKLKEWLERMGKPEKIKVAICNTGTYSPSSDCSNETDGMELRAQKVQAHFLNLEWRRLESLGRQAEVELGQEPPWMKDEEDEE